MAINIDPVALASAMMLVLSDCGHQTDAAFIHGSPTNNDVLDDQVLQMSVGLLQRGETSALVINGLEVEGEARLAYPGANVWLPKLKALSAEAVLQIPPSMHTAAEVEAVISLAHGMGWGKVTVISQRHHILRCMAQWVYCLEQAESDLKVYARTVPTVDWFMDARKVVLGGGTIEGKLLDHIKAEFDRLAIYGDRNCVDAAGKKKYTPNATCEEVIEYYSKRDQ
jgi:hypothetical protein